MDGLTDRWMDGYIMGMAGADRGIGQGYCLIYKRTICKPFCRANCKHQIASYVYAAFYGNSTSKILEIHAQKYSFKLSATI